MDFYTLEFHLFRRLPTHQHFLFIYLFGGFDEPSSRQFSASASLFHWFLILVLSAETMECGLEIKGGLRGPLRRGDEQGRGGWRSTCRQKEGGEEVKVRQVGNQAFLGLLVYLHGCKEPHTHRHTHSTAWAVWVRPVPSHSAAPL